MTAATASAQEIISKEAAAALKEPFIADIEEMKTKFVQLAGAFPDDKLVGRRGGQDARRDVEASHVDEQGRADRRHQPGFRARQSADLGGGPGRSDRTTKTATSNRSLYEFALMISGDMHEHLGQLIAYAHERDRAALEQAVARAPARDTKN
ncbi:MAG: hypothetical protein R2712_03230 [Vicinamibacterales bacterium]